MNNKGNRRQFLKGAIDGLGGMITSHFVGLFPETQSLSTKSVGEQISDIRGPIIVEENVAEFYGGFVLLSEHTAFPSYVQRGRGIELCKTDSSEDLALAGEDIQFENIEKLRNHISFPFFVPTVLPPEMGLIHAQVTQFVQSGDIWKASVYFGEKDKHGQFTSIHAQPEFHRPFPVWPVRLPGSYDGNLLYPEKLNLSPKEAVMLPSASGHVFQWIGQDILYSLIVEHDNNRDAALEILSSLAQI
ncbi:MAG: hypothetical protein KDE56_23720 [Anaerolineales bacterium]|nr:hypothetical protein [Anaerolineales bacterium]